MSSANKIKMGRKRRVIMVGMVFLCLVSFMCPAQEVRAPQHDYLTKTDADIITGARHLDQYLPLLKGKQVAFAGNHTSRIGQQHLVDSLLSRGIKIKILFSPEHGFRGKQDAGADVSNSKDKKTGLPIISLYGNHFQPTAKDMEGVDVVLFDLQDVGARFYTYLSTLHYIMKACAELNKPLIVLDRPNPNGYYIDGPVMEEKYKSFVGLHPVPVVYGMTIGEYAQMINGEGWLGKDLKCDLTVIKLEGYSRTDLYQLPVPPSPNLSTMLAVYLYPSLCLFEGTVMSVGRGTDFPFQVIGNPKLDNYKFSFTPVNKPGAMSPLYKGIKCKGYDLRDYTNKEVISRKQLYLWQMQALYKDYPDKANFFNSYFNSLAGTGTLKEQLLAGKTEDEIRASWQEGLNKFKAIRKKYLLYPDFDH
jgi:uncharacterized protein YbbC (DUF1343 family)